VKKLLNTLFLLSCISTLAGGNPGHTDTPHRAPPSETKRESTQAPGKVVEYDLEIAEQVVKPAGKKVRALIINGTIPGPTLRFKEGDWARIRVHNRLTHSETSLHWHGLLVPNAQDGVPHLTTPPTGPGSSHT